MNIREIIDDLLAPETDPGEKWTERDTAVFCTIGGFGVLIFFAVLALWERFFG